MTLHTPTIIRPPFPHLHRTFSVAGSPLGKPAFETIKGSSPVIFSFSHAGTALPAGFAPALWEGDQRHEVADWGTREIKDALLARHEHKEQQPSVIFSHISRLIVDFNRREQDAITYANERGEPILGNFGLTEDEREERLALHRAYMEAQAELIADIRERFGYVVFIDVHSFGTHHTAYPNVLVGSLRAEESSLSKIVEQQAAGVFGRYFETNAPYDLSVRPQNAVRDFMKRNGIPYIGLEFRQDFLSQGRHVQIAAEFLGQTADMATVQLAPDQHKPQKPARLPVFEGFGNFAPATT